MRRWLAGLVIAAIGALLPGDGRADEPPAPAGPESGAAADEAGWLPAWADPLALAPKTDSGFESASEEVLRRSRDTFENSLLQRVEGAKQASKLARAGKAMTFAGRVGSYSGILGAWSAGDHVGMAQEATNAFLGDVAAALGAAAAVALLPATASAGAIVAVAVVGSVLVSTAYDEWVKPGVDAAFDSGVDLDRDLDAMNQRIARARIWVADADVACAEARRALADARRAVGEASTAEETVRWLDDEKSALEARLARSRELAERARESASPAEVAAENAEPAERAEGLAVDAAGYADDACRIAGEMAGTRQADALRIWNRADRYLDGRASSVAGDAAGAVDEARDRSARVEEINALRREAAAAAAQAVSEVTALEGQVSGARARIELAIAEARRAGGLLQEAIASTEDCHSLKSRALALLDKAPWNGREAVRRVLRMEVGPIDPPFAEVEAMADSVPAAEAAVARASRQIESLAASVSELGRDLAQVPAPDPGAAARAAAELGRAEAARAEAERSAARAKGCAERARGLAEGDPGEEQRPEPGGGEEGWKRIGGVETVGGAATPSVSTAPAGPTLDDLLGAAESSFVRCNFAAARASIAQARALAPGDAHVAEVEARIEAKAERQSAAIAALRAAEQALANGTRRDAFAALDRAADAAPDCFTQQVSAVSSEVRDGLATQRKEADQRARTAVGGLLGTMIGAWNAGVAATGGSVAPGDGGAGVGGAPGGVPRSDTPAGAYCSINGAAGTADLFLLLRQRPTPQVTNYVIVATMQENAAAAASGSGMELVSRHTSYAGAVAAARQACPNPVQESY